MSQADELLDLFRKNNNRLTLGQILNTTLAAEYRARMTDLRKRDFRIDCQINRERPSDNVYTLTEPSTIEPIQIYFYQRQGFFALNDPA